MVTSARRRWAGIVAVVAAVVPGGCAAAESRATDDLERQIEANLADGADVEIEPNGDYQVSLDGTEIAEGIDLARPDWLGAEIPLPDDLQIHLTMTVDQFRVLRGTTAASAEEVEALYSEAFAALAYTIEQEWATEGPVAMKARGPGGDPISIEFTSEEFSLVLGRE